MLFQVCFVLIVCVQWLQKFWHVVYYIDVKNGTIKTTRELLIQIFSTMDLDHGR